MSQSNIKYIPATNDIPEDYMNDAIKKMYMLVVRGL